MTEKRFKLIGDSNIEFLLEDKLLLPIYDNDEQLSLKNTIDLLNEQNETIQRLEAQLSHLEYRFFEYRNKVGKND